jgi:hypothetical protein
MRSIDRRALSKETKMKFALIGAAAVAAAALATPAVAQQVITDPGRCAQFYPNANCNNLGAGNPYTVTIGCTAGNGKRSGQAAASTRCSPAALYGLQNLQRLDIEREP